MEKRMERVAFAKSVLRLSKEELDEKFCFAMDGTVIAMPPKDPTERMNFVRYDDEYVWRKPSETFLSKLGGHNDYPKQVPLPRAIPLWGGCSPKGFATVAFHAQKKFNKTTWPKVVQDGKLAAAIQALKPQRKTGPWEVLCDNEGFLATKASTSAMRAAKISMWSLPSRSPDLNPVERFWGWLKKKLKRMDLADAMKKRPVLGKTAYKVRVRNILKTKKAQTMAATYANSFRKACKEVVKKKGAATRF